jgi:hypothetical protein
MPAVKEKRGYHPSYFSFAVQDFSFFFFFFLREKSLRPSGLKAVSLFLYFISLSVGRRLISVISTKAYSFWVGTSRPSAVNHSIITTAIYSFLIFNVGRIKGERCKRIRANCQQIVLKNFNCFKSNHYWPQSVCLMARFGLDFFRADATNRKWALIKVRCSRSSVYRVCDFFFNFSYRRECTKNNIGRYLKAGGGGGDVSTAAPRGSEQINSTPNCTKVRRQVEGESRLGLVVLAIEFGADSGRRQPC